MNKNNLPLISIVIITFRRPNEIRQTIQSLVENLLYPPDRLQFIISDDCSGDGYLKALKQDLKFIQNLKLISTEQNSGWGANANNALAHCDGDFIYWTEDDYLLKKTVDLRAAVALMTVNQSIGLLRYDGIVGHRILAHLAESDISEFYPDFRQGLGQLGKVNYWLLDRDSRETWLYSNRPHFKKASFHSFYGWYPVGLKLGETEETYAHMVKDGMARPDAPAIACMSDFVDRWIDDIGKSYQHTDLDK